MKYWRIVHTQCMLSLLCSTKTLRARKSHLYSECYNCNASHLARAFKPGRPITKARTKQKNCCGYPHTVLAQQLHIEGNILPYSLHPFLPSCAIVFSELSRLGNPSPGSHLPFIMSIHYPSIFLISELFLAHNFYLIPWLHLLLTTPSSHTPSWP